MMVKVYSACPLGVAAIPISVEVDVRYNKLKISIVGLPDAATKESKERLIPAISNSGFALDNEDIVINLSPADMRKEGMGYDLPMAIGILAAKGIIPDEPLEDMLVLGELALDGTVRPVRSILASAQCAREEGLKTLIVPKTNGKEASLVGDLCIIEVESLAQLVHYLRGKVVLQPFIPEPISMETVPILNDMGDVKGHAAARRVLEIAAAGHHNLLFFGPPGSGKSMLGKRLPGIMPPLSTEEVIEVTRVVSCLGRSDFSGIVQDRPFRAPHHTASPISMIGGGSYPRPGEVTQAHRGVLFLDEFPEFPRHVLEVLRQPMEDRVVTISRINQCITFPADFLMVAAMNPCPCGWRGDRKRRCSCNEHQIKQYLSRISGPLLDRIDLHVEVPSLPLSTIRKMPPSEPSSRIRERVMRARAIQSERFGSTTTANGNMSPAHLRICCQLQNSLAEMLESKLEAWGCSKRAHDKVLRVARTLADLRQSAHIEGQDLLEAMAYRQLDRKPQVSALQAQEVPA